MSPFCFFCCFGGGFCRPLPLTPPEGFRALDTPNDAGKSVSLVWKASPADSKDRHVQIWMAEAEGKDEGKLEFKKITEFPSNTRYMKPGDFPWWNQPASKGDHYVKVASSQAFPIEDGKPYAAKLVIREGDQEVSSAVSEATPEPSWFNFAQINNLAFVLAFTGILMASINAARRNPHMYLRRIAGLDAVEEPSADPPRWVGRSCI